MPYRRRPARRSRRRRRPAASSYMTKAAKVATMALAAYRGVNYLKGLVNAEKHFLTNAGSASITNSGGVIALHGVAQGDTINDRNGNSIFARSLSGWLSLSRSQSAGNAVQVIKLAIVQDMQQVADSDPSYTSIWNAVSPLALTAVTQLGRYKILWSRVVHLDITSNVGAVKKVFLPMKHHIRYNGTATSDIQKGGLYLTYTTDQTVSNYPDLGYNLRLSFYDN